MSTQHMTIIRKHEDRYMTRDSCRLHGFGGSKCRVCLKNDATGDMQRAAKHRADVEPLVGHPRMGF